MFPGAYHQIGMLKEAETILREQVCPVYERSLGKHPFTATGSNCLGTILRKNGDKQFVSESLDCLRNALKFREELLGNHPDTARSYHELALWNCQQASNERKKGKNGEKFLEKAKRQLRRAIQIGVEVIGHTEDTAGSLQKLAEVCSSSGQDEEADKYNKQSEDIFKKFQKSRGKVADKVASPREKNTNKQWYSLAKSWITVFVLGWWYVFIFCAVMPENR